ncbi:protein required for normal CLN1 and CLN2 G1 cyclin expression [Kappamyces sp. JEL0680]|nr:protein required for normal CLN1 and CLN2 G1 cyclin expression [Kappamyces sp. JEL0680]
MSNERIDILLNNQVLEVDLNDLAGNEDPLIGIVSQDPSNHGLFLRFAFEYHSRGMNREFEKFLLAGKSQAQVHRLNHSDRHVLLLNCLAGYYIDAAKNLKEGEALPSCNASGAARSASILLRQAAELLNDAERISRTDKFTFIGKGLRRAGLMPANILQMNAKPGVRDENVLNNYKAALKLDANFIPALIGLGNFYFESENFKMALNYYQRVLTTKPDIVPDVRIPIGICFSYLNMNDEAALAFERALERDPGNVNAMLLLSLLEFNRSKQLAAASPEKKALVKVSNQRLFKAYQLDPRNSLCCIQMASRFFDKDMHKANVMASSSLLYTNEPLLKAEAHAIKGRIAHAKGDYKTAHENYKTAADLNPDSGVVQFHFGKTFVEAGNYEKAIAQLEKVLVKAPHDYDTLKLLFCLYSYQNLGDKITAPLEAIAKMSRKSTKGGERQTNVLEEMPIKDPELLSDVSQHLEMSNVYAARNRYMELLALLEKQQAEIPPELLNNIAVLYHLEAEAINSFYEGNFQVNFKISPDAIGETNLNQALTSAESLYHQALTVLNTESFLESSNSQRVAALQISIRYNVARLFECTGNIDKAELHYKELLKSHPAFTDCAT